MSRQALDRTRDTHTLSNPMFMLKMIILALGTCLIYSQYVYAMPKIVIEEQPALETEGEAIYIQVKALPNNQVEFTLKPFGLQKPLFGIAFDLVYDPTILEYKHFNEGTFFEQAGQPMYLVASKVENMPARVIVGISLRQVEKFPMTQQDIIRFIFGIKSSGKTRLLFENEKAYTLENNQKLALDNVLWKDTALDLEREQEQNTPPIGIMDMINHIFSWLRKWKFGALLFFILLASAAAYIVYVKKHQKRY